MQLNSFNTKCDVCGKVHDDGRLNILKLPNMTVLIGNTCANSLLTTLIEQFGIPANFNDE